jgi:hypothetical protein
VHCTDTHYIATDQSHTARCVHYAHTQKWLQAEKREIFEDYEIRVVNLKQQLSEAFTNDYEQLELIDVLQQQLRDLGVEPQEVQQEQETAAVADVTSVTATAAAAAAAVTATATATVAAVVAAAVAAVVAQVETRDEQPLSAQL